MQTKSRNGKFVLRASDDVPTGWDNHKRINVADVYLDAIEGKEITLVDVVDTIQDDCFCWDGLGLRLNVKKLNCFLTVGEREYKFLIKWQKKYEGYLSIIADQLKL